MPIDLDDELWECKEGGADLDWWLMTANLLEAAERFEEAALMRGDRRVMIDACPYTFIDCRITIENYRVRACTEEEWAMGRGCEPCPH